MAIQPSICSSLASSVGFVEESASPCCFLGNWSTLVSVGGMSGDSGWLVIFVLGMALATSSAAEAELTDSVDSLTLGVGSPSGSSSEAKRSGST